MAEYRAQEIEKKWQAYWSENGTYSTPNTSDRPKYYVLDMFPYPSGAGLHVGHPLGYIASDIVSRYKRLKGFNVLHPMGFDSFGLPAEQYAIQTGQHPAKTTAENIARYKEQLKGIGFCFDWDREVQTSSPDYYHWTQWIFMELFDSWYNQDSDKAEPIATLVAKLEKGGNADLQAVCDEDTPLLTAAEWVAMNEVAQQNFLLKYRLTFLKDTIVNYCPALGTVLANDEVKDGVSERGGHPVIRKNMKQWSMRITAYADRLLKGLDTIDWPDPLKEMQRNWIGKSFGAEFAFPVENSEVTIPVFTTRIDTVYGVSYLALAPESELVEQLVTEDQKAAIAEYVEVAKNRSERDRMADVKTVTGCFTGAYAINPFNQEKIPIWVADYVLAGYGTGAVMAVPGHDERDHRFAKHFDLPIIEVVSGGNIEEEAWVSWDHEIVNSGMLDGLKPKKAIEKAITWLEEQGLGTGKINYRMRDAVFTRQRYWGEPLPVYFKDGVPYLMKASELPLTLPEVDKYLPTENGDPPLGHAEGWKTTDGHPYELSTMPGWAGSSWYYFRYMDPKNDKAFVDADVQKYWESVDLYIGGSEHATGHLLYSRFWCKFLKDRGYVTVEEPFKKLVNQGMIQGRSNFVYREKGTNRFVSYGLRKEYKTSPMHVDVALVSNDELNVEEFKKWRPDLADAEFVLEEGIYKCGAEVEKMSKSKFNVVNPDDIIGRYGADTLRMYEMFLGPIEQSKPWNTNGIDGVFKFLRKFWNLFHAGDQFNVSDKEATKEELKVLHGTLKKTEEDIEKLSFNTTVAQFMICANELTGLKCDKRAVLEPLVIALSPFAPHITEELWHLLGHQTSVTTVDFPSWDKSYLEEDTFEYPVSVNGKTRTKLSFPVDASKEDIISAVLEDETVLKWTEGKAPKKTIVVPKRIINVVI